MPSILRLQQGELRLLLRRLMDSVSVMLFHLMINHSVSVNLMVAGCIVRVGVSVWLVTRLTDPARRPVYLVTLAATSHHQVRPCVTFVLATAKLCSPAVWSAGVTLASIEL